MRTQTLRKWIIFPCCLLIFGLVEELLYYKLELIANRHVRVGVMMFLYVAGISLVAFVITPAIEKIVLKFYMGTKHGFGWVGEILFVAILLLLTYFLWYQLFIYGPEVLLPNDWHNPFLARFIK